MGKRILITGATGFLGLWALRHWKNVHPDIELWATSDQPLTTKLYADKFIQVDLSDSEATQDMVSSCKPTYVVHFAGRIYNVNLAEYLRVNVIGTENLYNALIHTKCLDNVRVVQASSAAIYGLVHPEELPIKENQYPRPISSYALSKLAQDNLAYTIWRNRGLQIICARIFNILGPDQPDFLVPMTFIKQLIGAKTGLAKTLKVGNTSSRRDFVDVRDTISAIDILVKQGRPGEVYNIASGTDISIQEIVERLMAMSKLQIPVERVAERMQSNDASCIRADISKIVTETGWAPKIAFHKSLEAMWHQAANASDIG